MFSKTIIALDFKLPPRKEDSADENKEDEGRCITSINSSFVCSFIDLEETRRRDDVDFEKDDDTNAGIL